MKNIHLISTDKTTGIFKSGGNLLFSIMNKVRTTHEGFHLYITSDEEIKEGDYRLNIQRDYYKKADKEGLAYYNKRNDVFKKIILTTDQDLIADGVQSIDDEFLEWFVKNPSCESVEVDYDVIVTQTKALLQNQDNKTIAIPHRIHYKIIISKEKQKQYIIDIMKADEELGLYEEPKQIKCYCGHTTYCDCSPQEEPKQEKLEKLKDLSYWRANAEEDYMKVPISVLRYIYELENRMYSEEDLLSAFKAGMMFIGEDKGSFREWFEQFKKK